MKTAIAILIVICVSLLGAANLQAQKLAFDPKGDLFVLGGYEIFKYTPDGTKTTFATLSKTPTSLAFDRAGNLFVGDSGGSIFRFTPERTKSMFATGLTEASQLACDAAGNLFVGDSADSLIVKFTPNKRKNILATKVEPDRMVLDPSGNLLVPVHDNQSILKIAPDGAKSTLTTGIAYPFAPAVDASGNLFVHGDETIFKITPDGKKSAFFTGLNIDVWNAICDRDGNLFLADRNGDSILKFTPDGKKSTFGTVETPGEMVCDKAGNLFVQNDFAIYRFDPSGSKSTFSSDRLSPDKQWEYQCSDSGEGIGIVKAGTNQIVLDLSSDLDSRFASGADVVWAPDSRRVAINCRSGSHSAETNLYQLKDDKWVALTSPVDATTEILERAKAAERTKKGKSGEASESPDFDSWRVERWTDADTAILNTHLRGSDYRFVFTLKFVKDGNWKIVNQAKESAEK